MSAAGWLPPASTNPTQRFLPIPPPAADPDGKMGLYTIMAANNTYAQALSVGMQTKVGVVCGSGAALCGSRPHLADCLLACWVFPAVEEWQPAQRHCRCTAEQRGWAPDPLWHACLPAVHAARQSSSARARCPPHPSPARPNPTQIGVTPMLGLNDVETETFYLTDAHQVRRCWHLPRWGVGAADGWGCSALLPQGRQWRRHARASPLGGHI
jgi:hypothetical protein